MIALRDRGFPVEYMVAPDEGHGFARPINNIALYTAAEKFLAKHLGGRYQETMTPEVAKRLGGDHGRSEDGDADQGRRTGGHSAALTAALPASSHTGGVSHAASRCHQSV